MKTFRELLGSSFKERKTVVGSFAPFRRDVYKSTYLDPHKEMQANWEGYMYNSLTNAAVNAQARFIFGNEIKIISSDAKTQKFLETYLAMRNFDQEIYDVILKTLIAGNGYLEVDYDQKTGIPDRFYSIADPSRMYVNFDKYGKPRNDEEAFLQRVDPIYNESDARWYEISYHIGYSYHKIRIKAIPIDFHKIVHFKLNKSINDIYGRANITSTVNDNEALQEMEKAIAMLVKYRAVPKKIIEIGNQENPATGEDILDLQNVLDNLEMEENPIVNKPIKLQDLSYVGGEMNMEYMLKHARMKLIAGIAPEFLLGLGDEVNRATAHEQLVAFILSVESDRKIFINQITERVLKPIIKFYHLDPNTTIEFGKLDFESEQDKVQRVNQMWTSNLITLNQAREEMGMPKIKGNDMFYAQWVMELGMESKPQNPEGAVFPKPETPKEPAIAGELPAQEPAFKPKEPTPGTASFRESADLIIEREFELSTQTFFEQTRDEIIRDLETFKEGLRGKKEINQLLDSMELLITPYVTKACFKAFKNGYKEAARTLGDSEEITDKAIQKKVSQYAMKDIKSLNAKQKEKLRALLEDYFKQGLSTRDVVKKVEKEFDMARWQALRIVRTEITRLHSFGVREAIKKSDVTDKYQWITHIRKGTADLDEHLNGKIFTIGKEGNLKIKGKKGEYVIPANPLPVKDTHPNCKCTIVPYIKRGK